MAETVEQQQLIRPVEQGAALGELMRLAAPTIAQMASYTVMQFIDTWMLSRLGTDAPTAAGNAGIFAFAVISFGVGVLLVVNALVSQEFGRKEFDKCGRFLWQGIWFAMAYALLLLPALPWLSHVFSHFGHPANLLDLETKYLQITIGMAVFKLTATSSGQFLLATDRPNTVLLAALCGVAFNGLCAYAIILGGFGFPKLGVVGAAWAQNAGGFVEMAILFAFAFNRTSRTRFNSLDWKFRVHEFVKLVKVGFGSGVQIVADVLAWSLFIVMVMAKLGEHAMAANQFMFRYMTVSFMPAFGIAQAVTALVGRYIGAGRPDIAMQRANLGFKVAAGYMFICGLIFAIFRYQLIHVFTYDPEVVRLGVILLLFAAAYQLFDAMYVVYNGALRGAGDTFVPAMVTATLCWGVNVFGGYMIASHLPQSGVAGPWVACSIYGLTLGVFCLARFRHGNWRKIHLIDEADSNSRGFDVKTQDLVETVDERR